MDPCRMRSPRPCWPRRSRRPDPAKSRRPELRAEMGRVPRPRLVGRRATSRSAAAARSRSRATSPSSSRPSRGCCPSRACSTARSSSRRANPAGSDSDWESLSQRIHPAASRVNMLAETDPGDVHRLRPSRARRPRPSAASPSPERRAAARGPARRTARPVHVTRTTDDRRARAPLARRVRGRRARRRRGEAARPAVCAEQAHDVQDQARAHRRCRRARVPHPQVRRGVGSLLSASTATTGASTTSAASSAFSDARRLELIDELAPLVERDDEATRQTRRGREIPLPGGPGRLPPSCACGRSGCSRCATTSSRDGGSATRCSSSGWRPDRDPRVVHVRPARDRLGLRPRRRARLTSPVRDWSPPTAAGTLGRTSGCFRIELMMSRMPRARPTRGRWCDRQASSSVLSAQRPRSHWQAV